MKNQIIEMLQQGCSYDEIVEAVQCAKSTINYHARKLGLIDKQTPHVKYDWKQISDFYQTHSYSETREAFGFAKGAWDLARKRGDIVSRGYGDLTIPLQEILQGLHPQYKTYTLKKRLIADGIKNNCCELCGQLPMWNGKPLVLQLDHINGISNDHRLENLQLICPNCHTQTDTYAGRNKNKM